MNINQIFIIIQIGLIPSIISLIKYIFKERTYKLLYIYIVITYLIEFITNRLIYNRYILVSNIVVNIYLLFEFIVLIKLMEQIVLTIN